MLCANVKCLEEALFVKSADSLDGTNTAACRDAGRLHCYVSRGGILSVLAVWKGLGGLAARDDGLNQHRNPRSVLRYICEPVQIFPLLCVCVCVCT